MKRNFGRLIPMTLLTAAIAAVPAFAQAQNINVGGGATGEQTIGVLPLGFALGGQGNGSVGGVDPGAAVSGVTGVVTPVVGQVQNAAGHVVGGVVHEAGEVATGGRDRALDLLGQAHDTAEGVRDHAEDAVGEVHDHAEDAVGDAYDRYQDAKGTLNATTANTNANLGVGGTNANVGGALERGQRLGVGLGSVGNAVGFSEDNGRFTGNGGVLGTGLNLGGDVNRGTANVGGNAPGGTAGLAIISPIVPQNVPLPVRVP